MKDRHVDVAAQDVAEDVTQDLAEDAAQDVAQDVAENVLVCAQKEGAHGCGHVES